MPSKSWLPNSLRPGLITQKAKNIFYSLRQIKGSAFCLWATLIRAVPCKANKLPWGWQMQGTRQLGFIPRGLEDLVPQPGSSFSRGVAPHLWLHLSPKIRPALLAGARRGQEAVPRALCLPPFIALAPEAGGQRGCHLQLWWGLTVSEKDEVGGVGRSLEGPSKHRKSAIRMKLTPSQSWCARVQLQSQKSWRQEF